MSKSELQTLCNGNRKGRTQRYKLKKSNIRLGFKPRPSAYRADALPTELPCQSADPEFYSYNLQITNWFRHIPSFIWTSLRHAVFVNRIVLRMSTVDFISGIVIGTFSYRLYIFIWFEKEAYEIDKRQANKTISTYILLGHIFPYLQWNKWLKNMTSFFIYVKCVEFSVKFEENTIFRDKK